MTSKTTAAFFGDQFQMQTGFFDKAVEGINQGHSLKRMNEKINHISWITGHIVSCRYMLCGMLGVKASEPFPEFFGNLKGIDESFSYPNLDELTADMPAITKELTKKLSEMSDEELQKEAFGGKLVDIIQFFIYHEAYHIGQIGILRKALGYEAIIHG